MAEEAKKEKRRERKLRKLRRRVKRVARKTVPTALVTLKGVPPAGVLRRPTTKIKAKVRLPLRRRVPGPAVARTVKGDIAVVRGTTAAVMVGNQVVESSNFLMDKLGQIIPVAQLGDAKRVKEVLQQGGRILTTEVVEDALAQGIDIPEDIQEQVKKTSTTIFKDDEEPRIQLAGLFGGDMMRFLPILLLIGAFFLMMKQDKKEEDKK